MGKYEWNLKGLLFLHIVKVLSGVMLSITLPNWVQLKGRFSAGGASPRLKNFNIFFVYVHYHKLKKKHILHVRIRQFPGTPTRALPWTHWGLQLR
jgi:hypothetical protein